MNYSETVTVDSISTGPIVSDPNPGPTAALPKQTILVSFKRSDGTLMVVSDTLANAGNYTLGATHTLTIG